MTDFAYTKVMSPEEEFEWQLLERKLTKEGKMYPPLEKLFPLTSEEHYRLEEHKQAIEERRGSIEHEVKTANAKLASERQVGGDHYKKMKVQTWDVVDTWPREQRIGYYRGNALKYIMRIGSKDEEIQEASKGAHYLEKLIEVLKEPK